ncbi:MAG: 2-C-methyl-D-erythritol 4-phosphate cytidylyltransferase [Ruminococcus sp.]|nr:2-C-methyl-D-erythritol 4-phosphate cytidylyltransferase [Candidatus Apopatosoma intestinale]
MKNPVQSLYHFLSSWTPDGKKFTSAVIVAGGSSTRMGGTSKQQIVIDGKSVIVHTLLAFERCEKIDEIVLVSSEKELPIYNEEFKTRYGLSKLKKVVLGGISRADSAECGFQAVSDKADFVAIHDGARCLITPEDIEKVVRSAYKTGASIAAIPSVDTLKKVGKDGRIVGTVNRQTVWQAQTPQVFMKKLYLIALKKAAKKKTTYTDDAMMVEAAGFHVYCAETSRNNIKITVPEDVETVSGILKGRLK